MDSARRPDPRKDKPVKQNLNIGTCEVVTRNIRKYSQFTELSKIFNVIIPSTLTT